MRPILLLLLFAFCSSLSAEQLSFSSSGTTEAKQYNYRWIDHLGREQSLSFTLDLTSTQGKYRAVKNYMPNIAQRHVYVEMMKFAQSVDPKEARIQIQQIGQDIRFKVRSRSPEFANKWRSEMASKQENAFQAYLDANYYTYFDTFYGKRAIKPDHIRYLNESQRALIPVAQALFDKVGPNRESKEYVNLMLSWIQSIPYNELVEKSVSRGSGYLSPIEVLNSNIGDCDSKTTLAATVLKSLLPRLSMAIVYVPGHALLAANLPRSDLEQTIEIEGMRYVLLEPTGPALMIAGKVGDKSMKDIASGMFSYEKVK